MRSDGKQNISKFASVALPNGGNGELGNCGETRYGGHEGHFTLYRNYCLSEIFIFVLEFRNVEPAPMARKTPPRHDQQEEPIRSPARADDGRLRDCSTGGLRVQRGGLGGGVPAGNE